MAPEDIAKLAADLQATDERRLGAALQTAAKLVPSPEVLALVPDVVAVIQRLQRHGERDYGVALHLLSRMAAHATVPPRPFLDAFELYPDSNESEIALTASKAILRDQARRGDRAAFDAFCGELDALGQLHYMKTTIDALVWADPTPA